MSVVKTKIQVQLWVQFFWLNYESTYEEMEKNICLKTKTGVTISNSCDALNPFTCLY